MEFKEDGSTVPAVERALDILELLESDGAPLTMTAIAESLGLPRASVHRLLATLTARGYVTRDGDPYRTYRPGTRWAALGARAAARMDIPRIAGPLLERLAAETGEGCQLSVRVDRQAVCLLRVPSPIHPEITLTGGAGHSFPLHATAIGKALLAFAPESVRTAYSQGPLPPQTARTLTDPAALCAELETIRHQGFALDDEEYKPGLCAFAAPVFGGGAVVVAAIALPFLKAAAPSQDYCAAVVRTAGEISALTGAGVKGTFETS
ncbi:MAG: IclR family transcriptional regulator [Capsulimonadales bacterium]|nr:IclR family transcriptional regulator [Capsulimonadales bacterium]